jgi:two-component sensor histidine kinase/ligand-binding sensor protein
MIRTKRELLDPDSWNQVLNLCAHAMQIAVTLTDPEGNLVGVCHNPQPIWALARKSRPDWGEGCPFCLRSLLDPSHPCTAAADALRTGSVVLVHDVAGLAHVALPIYLGPEHLGTLIAGQVFDRYPDPLLMERAAKEFGLSREHLWNIARQQTPVSTAALKLCGNLLDTLGHALLGQRYGIILENKLATTDAELRIANKELKLSNLDLQANVIELHKANAQKTALLQEVHHRVNNNLQVIASLLRAQAESAENIQVTDALRTSQGRIDAMALIHAQFIDTADLSEIDFAGYVARLLDSLFISHGADQNQVTGSVEMAALTLPLEQAIPAGLILGELISNAIKHAFPDQRRGSILIEGSRQGGRIELRMRDNGVGLAERPEPVGRKSHGLKIVKILTGQLHGRLERIPSVSESGSGTGFRISFPDKASTPTLVV